MNHNAITMTTDNSRNRKQANHRGPGCVLICICMQRGRAKSPKRQARVPTENGEGHWRRMGGLVGLCAKGLSSLPGCMLLSLALSSPIKPATPQQ